MYRIIYINSTWTVQEMVDGQWVSVFFTCDQYAAEAWIEEKKK